MEKKRNPHRGCSQPGERGEGKPHACGHTEFAWLEQTLVKDIGGDAEEEEEEDSQWTNDPRGRHGPKEGLLAVE